MWDKPHIYTNRNVYIFLLFGQILDRPIQHKSQGDGFESENERGLKEKEKNRKAFKEEKKWRGVADRRLQAANGGTVTRRIT